MEINPYQSPPEQPPRRRNVILWIAIVVAISIPLCGCCLWPTLVDLLRWFSP